MGQGIPVEAMVHLPLPHPNDRLSCLEEERSGRGGDRFFFRCAWNFHPYGQKVRTQAPYPLSPFKDLNGFRYEVAIT
jgi:hypothetical protein